jgi:hypothetical protein
MRWQMAGRYPAYGAGIEQATGFASQPRLTQSVRHLPRGF